MLVQITPEISKQFCPTICITGVISMRYNVLFVYFFFIGRVFSMDKRLGSTQTLYYPNNAHSMKIYLLLQNSLSTWIHVPFNRQIITTVRSNTPVTHKERCGRMQWYWPGIKPIFSLAQSRFWQITLVVRFFLNIHYLKDKIQQIKLFHATNMAYIHGGFFSFQTPL